MEKAKPTQEQPHAVDQSAMPVAPAPLVQPTSPVKKIENMETKKFLPLIAVAIVLAGIATGWALSGTSQASKGNSGSEMKSEVNTESLGESEGIEGIDVDDEDAPVGVIREGGVEGEGTHRLERGLGPEKDVYLLSTVLNLDNFVGKKVQIWGQDLGAKEVGWLMDVVKVKLLE